MTKEDGNKMMMGKYLLLQAEESFHVKVNDYFRDRVCRHVVNWLKN